MSLVCKDLEQSDESEKHEDSEKQDETDNDEESICLSDFDHNAVDNQDSEDVELENALPAGYAAALVTKNKNFGKSLNTKPLKRTTDAIDDVETLREQKKRKIQQLQAELQQDEAKAPYDQDVQILKVSCNLRWFSLYLVFLASSCFAYNCISSCFTQLW